MDIIIKEARPEDAAKLIEYTKLVGAQTDNLSFGKEGIGDTLEVEKEFIKRINSDPKSVMYYAWKNDDIVGSANIFLLLYSSPSSIKSGYQYSLFDHSNVPADPSVNKCL